MQAAPQHKIRRNRFNVKHYGRANAFALQATAEQFCKDVLLPKIEALLEQYNNVTESIYIDKLKIDVSSKSVTSFDLALANKIVNELKQSLADKVHGLSVNDRDSNDPENSFHQLVFFLKNGFIKEGGLSNTITIEETIALSLQQKDAKEIFLKTLQFIPAVERLSILLNEKQWWDIIEQLSLLPASKVLLLQDDLSIIKSLLDEHSYNEMFSNLKVAVLQLGSSGGHQRKLIKNIQDHLIQAGISLEGQAKDVLINLESVFFKPLTLNKKEYIKKDEVVEELPVEQKELNKIYVANAGLVLVAAYLPSFFNNLNLQLAGDRRDDARALSLLHYLATGTGEAEEWLLVLPKLLIGIPLQKFVRLDFMLTEDDKQKADELLAAIITNWAVLKSTTIDGLRQTFIQRSGTLSFRDNRWHLFIEPESFDLLLDHLPWQISMIRLPWMKHVLQVNWR